MAHRISVAHKGEWPPQKVAHKWREKNGPVIGFPDPRTSPPTSLLRGGNKTGHSQDHLSRGHLGDKPLRGRNKTGHSQGQLSKGHLGDKLESSSQSRASDRHESSLKLESDTQETRMDTARVTSL